MDRLSTKGSIIDQLDLDKAPRSGFDRSFHNYLSSKIGTIVPTRVEEVLPGDRIKGSSHIVAQFEPLVGPILANMVLKQETFYVPQSVLWKSAHKFFTGKKGYNQNIPSVTLSQIAGALNQYTNFAGIIDTLQDTCVDLELDSIYLADQQDWEQEFIPLILDASNGWNYTDDLDLFAEQNGLVDLIAPFKDIMHIEGMKVPLTPGQSPWIGNPNWTIKQQVEYFVSKVIDTYNFWFGPSSQLDYMGCGVYNFDETAKTFFQSTGEGHEHWYDVFSDIPLNWIPFRAAYAIWYWNYRDQLLETSCLDAEDFLDSDSISDSEILQLLLVRRRCWFKDTFTTALTNTGDGNLLIPSINTAYASASQQLQVGLTPPDLTNTTDANAAHAAGADIRTMTIGGITYNIPSNYLINSGSNSTKTAAYYVSLDMIDRARRLSSWVSKRLALGVEYDDVVWSSFMVKLSHVRMRTPELLDSGRSTVSINTIVNNTTIPDAQVAGDKAAVAWAENTTDGVNYFAEEHGYLLSFYTILPIQSYAGGINRMYLRRNRFDFAWPEFSQMGFDAVYNAELATPQGGLEQDTAAVAVFGYQGRYYDYKSKLDEEHGRMRSDLNWMTFSRDFSLKYNAANAPKLNYQFVHCWPALDMFVTDDPNVDVVRAVDVNHNYHWERVLPVPSDILR